MALFYERMADKSILSWFTRRRRKPLILRGARQVGKSTLVRSFANKQSVKHGFKLIEINLESRPELDDIFKSLDSKRILRELSAVSGVELDTSGSQLGKPYPNTVEHADSVANRIPLLFLDEVQATPHAIPALRYLHETHPELPIICAGSLLEFVLRDHQFSMPVGRVEYLYLYPMSFEEFLTARKETQLVSYLQQLSLSSLTLPQQAHRRLTEAFREFLFVGGMPDAVRTFIETSQLSEVTRTHAIIVETYRDDFSKYATYRQLNQLRHVFDYIPRSLGQKTKYVNISREESPKDLRFSIELLTLAGIALPVHHSDCSGLPLKAGRDDRRYKLMFLDIGLANRVCRLDWRSVSNLDSIALINNGPLAEQFVAQHLHTAEENFEKASLHYWLREGKHANAEVDFVISRGTRIVPIEVKSGKSGSLKSLVQFALSKSTTFAIRFDLNMPSIQEVSHAPTTGAGRNPIRYSLLSLPIYAIGQFGRLIDEYRDTANAGVLIF